MSYSGINELDNQYGRLTVLNRAGSNKHGDVMWLCHCECGAKVEICGSSLRRGATKSCGCLQRELTSIRQFKNEVGKEYGDLTVISHADINRYGQHLWLCHCKCGNETLVRAGSLRAGSTKSCGCLQRRRSSEARKARSLPPGEAAFNSLVLSMRHRAKRRNLLWSLTATQVRKLTSQVCYYCGVQPYQKGAAQAKFNGVYLYNGLDRVDNNRDYEIDNVVPCCGVCNKMKGTMKQDEFLARISRIYKYPVLKEKDETLP